MQRKKLREKFQTTQQSEVADQVLPVKEHVFLTTIRALIEENLDREDFSVEELSQKMAMSRTQLHRKVKALTNASVSLYIRNVRLNHAMQLLKDGLYNVSEVAYRVGFNSQTYFSTCFTEHFGYPPSEIRQFTNK